MRGYSSKWNRVAKREDKPKRRRRRAFSGVSLAKEFNEAFDKVFCASRPWMRDQVRQNFTGGSFGNA